MTVRELRKTPEGRAELERIGRPLMETVAKMFEPQLFIAPPLSRPVHLDHATMKEIADLVKQKERGGGANGSRGEKRLIEYWENNFYTNGNVIDFLDQEAFYVLLVKALFFEADEKGFMSDEKIDRYFVKEGKKNSITNKDERRKRITNALAHLQHKPMSQKRGFPMKTPDGLPVINKRLATGLFSQTRSKSNFLPSACE